MTDVDDSSRADDYEYDEAHDAGEMSGARRSSHSALQRQPAAMQVTDDAGDYGYDAAHNRC